MRSANAATTAHAFKIGAVARMTGLSADTIRVWERRYKAVAPRRTATHNRLYGNTDIARLALIKRLVDAGDRVGSVAHLSVEELQARLQAHDDYLSTVPTPSRSPRVVILGAVLPAQLSREAFKLDGLEIVALYQNRQLFEDEVGGLQADELVVEYPTLHAQDITEIRRLMETAKADHACVIYGFSAQTVIRKLDNHLVTPLRAPIDLAELRHVIMAAALSRGVGSATSSEPPAINRTESLPYRRYDDETLGRIARAATPVQCECPHHLVDIIRSLIAFETYSAECENRNVEDAALHAFLHATTAEARAKFENALTDVLRADGLQIRCGL